MKSKRWIVLHAERVGQLERLAKRRATTIAGTVEGLIADRVAAGEIEAGFSGFHVERDGAEVRITLNDVRLVPIPAADAARLALDLAALATKATGAASLTLPDGVELTAKRNGPAGITIAAGAAHFKVSRAMLEEISGQLAEAAR